VSRGLILLLGAVAFSIMRPVAQSPRLFTFHSNAWVNLHHVVRATARGAPAPAGLSAEELAQWTAGADFYKPYSQRDLLSDEMVAIKDALRGAEGKATLDRIAIDAGVKSTLERLMPIYRRSAWPEHDRANRAWIAALQPLLDRHGLALSRAMARAYDTTWPRDPIPVDLVPSAGANGAYTGGPPTAITIASTDSGYQGLKALEMVFHESSHSGISNLFSRVSEAASDQGVTVPPQLWHGVLFFTAGELTSRELKAHGIAYTEYADAGLYKNLCGDGCREKIAEHWLPRLDGKRSVAESLTSLVAAFRQR
jgi:hypothetical protein